MAGILGSIIAFSVLGMAMSGVIELYGDAMGIVFLIIGLLILFLGSGTIAKTKGQNDAVFWLGWIIVLAPFFIKLANRTEPLPKLGFIKLILLFITLCIFLICVGYFYSVWWEPRWEETVHRRFWSRNKGSNIYIDNNKDVKVLEVSAMAEGNNFASTYYVYPPEKFELTVNQRILVKDEYGEHYATVRWFGSGYKKMKELRDFYPEVLAVDCLDTAEEHIDCNDEHNGNQNLTYNIPKVPYSLPYGVSTARKK